MKEHSGKVKSLVKLGIVNCVLWALAIVALVFIIQDSPEAKGMFTLLAGGSTVATILFSSLLKLLQDPI
jgi:hypothetical protein